jgi:SAM-dependent methyltransferase
MVELYAILARTVSAREHWGRRPLDWASLAEPSNEPLFAEVLRRLGAGPGTKLLDVGCGSGYAARMAAEFGAEVTGIDVTPELLEIARERLPGAEFVEGDMDSLPFPDESFDGVVGFNAFQFADDPVGAVREGARVLRPGGRLAATTFAEPERNESTALHLALEPLRATGRAAGGEAGAATVGEAEGATASEAGAGRHLPYALSEPGGLEELLRSAGLSPCDAGEVALAWAHPDVDQAVRAVLASGGGAMAIEAGGEDAARAALEEAVLPFTSPDGSVRMNNVFRFVIGTRS